MYSVYVYVYIYIYIFICQYVCTEAAEYLYNTGACIYIYTLSGNVHK